ncbi:MAG: metallophosphoesterase [Clostridia bacterium]|nr:metallophosphoesterase [Clostridia bacterium]
MKAIITRQFKKVLISKVSIICFTSTLVAFLCFLYAYFIEPYNIQVSTTNVFSGKLVNESLRIVHISDLHCDTKTRNEYKLKELINPLQPDIIVFTGDSLNSLQALPNFKASLQGLNAKFGKFAVKGNIDVWYYDQQDVFSETGFKVLDNEAIKLKKGNEIFHIAGIPYGSEYMTKKVIDKIPSSTYNVFLYHTPDLIEDKNIKNIDLYLAGHTHGGQIRLPLYGALVTLSKFGKKYEMGRYQVQDTLLYVNRGIGMEGGSAPRMRFLARPEITVVDVKPKKLGIE